MKRKQIIESDFEDVPASTIGVILEKKLINLIYGDRLTNRQKSVSKPFAPTTNQCGTELATGSLTESLESYKNQIMNDSKELWYLLKFMSISGCRVTEALNIKTSDITKDGRVIVRGLKNSESRFVSDSELCHFFSHCKKNNRVPFMIYNRFFIYRYLKKLGLYSYFGESTKASVTHSFRHLAILDMKEIDKGLQLTKQSIGHKSIKSTKHYANGREQPGKK